MKKVSNLALAASIIVGGALISTPAVAQKKKAEAAAPAQAAGWQPKLTKAEAAALKPVEVAVNANDWATAATALAAAQPAATSPDARYYVGRFQLQIGVGTNNSQLQSQGIDAMIASGGGDPTQAVSLYKNQGAIALQTKDYAKAEAAFSRWAQLAPNDIDAQMATGEVKFRQNKRQEALPLFERAIAARKAAGQAVPESWYLLALQSALDAKMAPQAETYSQALLSTYPTGKNWRNALLIYRQNNSLDQPTQMDLFRLMRATKSLERGDEWLGLAGELSRQRFYSEAKGVIDEGIAAGKISRTDATAAAILKEASTRVASDRAALPGLEAGARSGANGSLALKLAEAYYGHNDYAKAADLYRLALQKGGVDANLVNSRLGIALAMGGRRAEAETAFKAVTGNRARLASYWMLWLAQRA
jgi:tetratricopeptide (TPR) repeat protein